MENSKEKKAITGAKKKKELGKVHSCSMNLFIEGYGSSTITESLCWLLRKFKGFKKICVEPATKYPCTTCSIYREANRDEAKGSFVSR